MGREARFSFSSVTSFWSSARTDFSGSLRPPVLLLEAADRLLALLRSDPHLTEEELDQMERSGELLRSLCRQGG